MGIIQNKLPWDLRQRGRLDSDRHAKKIREAIKKNLHHIIAEEAIITSDGKRTTKVPVKYLDSYHFKHGKPGDMIGHGPGKPGDVLRPGNKGQDPGQGRGAGKERGLDIYEASVSVSELTDMMLEDLGLPHLEDKDKVEIVTSRVVYNDMRKTGIMANWLKKKTIIENMKRNAQEHGEAKFDDINQDDMRFRTWNEVIERHSNAVVYLMMDRSGSMDDHKRYLSKAVFWWLCRFMEKKYDNVEVVFIAHDYEAQVVSEKDFFEISNSGGTRCSSAYELAWADIKQSRPQNIWNVYCFHFSDGDNSPDDDALCVSLVKEMLQRVNMFAYGEVSWENEGWKSDSSLRETLDKIDHPRLLSEILHSKTDVYPTLEKFLKKDMGEDA